MARRGADAVSLSQIAAAAGIHKATLFYYVPQKSDLAREVFLAVARRLLPRFEALAAPGEPSLDRFLALADGLAEDFAAEPAMAGFLMRAMVAPFDSTFAVDTRDREHPVTRSLSLLRAELARASRAGAVRRVDVRQAILHFLALVLFQPAAAEHLGELAGIDPLGAVAQRARRRELAAFVRGALAP
jgi:AcrR family transcriptional regulator